MRYDINFGRTLNIKMKIKKIIIMAYIIIYVIVSLCNDIPILLCVFVAGTVGSMTRRVLCSVTCLRSGSVTDAATLLAGLLSNSASMKKIDMRSSNDEI